MLRRYRFERPKLGVLASGRGSNMFAILKAIHRGNLPAELAVVISDRPDAGALGIARQNNIYAHSVAHVPARIRDSKITELLRRHEVDVVVLAGYLKLIGEPLLTHYSGRVINIHPGPLPRFGGRRMYGLHVHEAVIKAGIKDTGPTIHLVNEEFDAGEILEHVPVAVMPDDTPESLAERVLPMEHDTYWRVIRRYFCK